MGGVSRLRVEMVVNRLLFRPLEEDWEREPHRQQQQQDPEKPPEEHWEAQSARMQLRELQLGKDARLLIWIVGPAMSLVDLTWDSCLLLVVPLQVSGPSQGS